MLMMLFDAAGCLLATLRQRCRHAAAADMLRTYIRMPFCRCCLLLRAMRLWLMLFAAMPLISFAAAAPRYAGCRRYMPQPADHACYFRCCC